MNPFVKIRSIDHVTKSRHHHHEEHQTHSSDHGQSRIEAEGEELHSEIYVSELDLASNVGHGAPYFGTATFGFSGVCFIRPVISSLNLPESIKELQAGKSLICPELAAIILLSKHHGHADKILSLDDDSLAEQLGSAKFEPIFEDAWIPKLRMILKN